MNRIDQSETPRQVIPLSTHSRWAILLYATVCYAGFHAVFLWMVMFLNDIPILPSVNSGTPRYWPLPSRSTSASSCSSACSTA